MLRLTFSEAAGWRGDFCVGAEETVERTGSGGVSILGESGGASDSTIGCESLDDLLHG